MKKIPLKMWLLIKEHHDRFKVKSLYSTKALKTLALAAALGISLAFLVVLMVMATLPPIDDIRSLVAAQSSVILDRNGEVLYTIHGDENRTTVDFDEISPYASKAVVAMEDDRFYDHMGVDFSAILKAVCSEVGLCNRRGGSTITQQFVKNAFLSPERTYTRKLKEILLAMQLERRFDKNEILAMYLNRIPYGANIFGVEVAAKGFFGKPAKDLTIAESAILAGIPNAPTYYSPYGAHRYSQIDLSAENIIRLDVRSEADLVEADPSYITRGLLGRTYLVSHGEVLPVSGLSTGSDSEESEEDDEEVEETPTTDDPNAREIYIKGRTDLVIARMLELGYITKEEADAAIEEAREIQFKTYREDIKAPHFVMYIREQLEEKYGKEKIEKGGLVITTTLDVALQEAAEKAMADRVERNEANFGATNASLVSVDTETGEIMAMVGSRDYWNDEIDGKVNVALRQRLPGSSFKPIAYAASFLQGYAPSTVVYDVRTNFGNTYEPENYDGTFLGPVNFRNALGASRNIPAVKAAYLAGVPNVLDLARKMGLTLNQPDDWYGLSLALGAGEVRPLDMALAYSTFANGGYKVNPVSILRVEDQTGAILEEYEAPEEKELILDPQVAYLINDVLSDVAARPGEYWQNQLSIPGKISAAKTGTSNKKVKNINYPFDTWTIGYTRHLSTAVWGGNASGEHLNLKASGLDVASHIWRNYMIEATKDEPKTEFERPSGIKWVQVSKRSGKLPSEHTPEEDIVSAVFASFSVPSEVDDMYQFVELDKVSGKLATEYTPDAAREEKGFFTHHSILRDKTDWEEAVRKWAKENKQDEQPPTEYDDVHTPDSVRLAPEVSIIAPESNVTVTPPSLGVQVRVRSTAGVAEVWYYLNDELAYKATSAPFTGRIQLDDKLKKGTPLTVRAVAYDKLYRSATDTVQVQIGDDNSSPIVRFTHPNSGTEFTAGTAEIAEVSAYDPGGDIDKVQFFMNDKLSRIAESPPYNWQFVVPDETGEHTLRAVATDHAGNTGEDTLTIRVEASGNLSITGDSRILDPRGGSSFESGDRVSIRAYIGVAERGDLKKLTVMAKGEKGLPVEVATATVEGAEGAAQTYSFLWNAPANGEYELYLKMDMSSGSTRFSKRTKVEVE